jgi:hypothetical protein
MDLRVHLKVCEGCGCLWYRSQVDSGVYCAPCAQRFKEFPTPESRKRRGRPKKVTLPTVFAVEDSTDAILQEAFSNLASHSLPIAFQPRSKFGTAICPIAGGSSSFHPALLQMASPAASFTAPSALAASILPGGVL